MKEIVTNKTLEVVDLLTNQPLSNYLYDEDIKVSFNNADINVIITKPIDETILKVEGILSGDLSHIVNGSIRNSNPYEATIRKEEEDDLSYYDEFGLIRTDKRKKDKSVEIVDCSIDNNLLETKFIRRPAKKRKKYII